MEESNSIGFEFLAINYKKWANQYSKFYVNNCFNTSIGVYIIIFINFIFSLNSIMIDLFVDYIYKLFQKLQHFINSFL